MRWGMPRNMKASYGLSILAAALVTSPLTGCSVFKSVFTPEQARLEAELEEQQAEVAKTPDGECGQAETCKRYCEISERPLDCFKTGKAAMLGVDVHYAGGYRIEAVAGSTDDVEAHYEEESNEHQSLLPLAISSFETACKGNHPESCRRSGELAQKSRPAEARTFFEKACALKDQPACEQLAKSN